MSQRESEGVHYLALSEDPTVVLMEHEGRQAIISRKTLRFLSIERLNEYYSDDGLTKDAVVNSRDAVACDYIAEHGTAVRTFD